MKVLLFFLGLFILVSLAIGVLAYLTGKKTFKDRNKISSYECGFDTIRESRIPFSVRFFLITVIFLVFDIEIALLLPLGVIIKVVDLFLLVFVRIVVIIVLGVGLVHEWNQGALNWIN